MNFFYCTLYAWLVPFFACASQVSTFEENGKVGLKNDRGQILIPAQYEALGWSDGKISVVGKVTGYKLKDHWGLISTENHRITKAEYTELLPAENSLFVARKKTNLSLRFAAGCINTSGKVMIPFQYDGLSISSLRAIVIVRSGNQFLHGLIDLSNTILIPIKYRSIYPLGSLRYAAENFEKKISIYTDTGKQITDFSIDSISAYKKNYAIIFQNHRQGIIDRDGNVKVESRFREIHIDDNGAVKAREADEWFFLDGQNQMLRKYLADSISPIGKNLLKISHAGEVFFSDKEFNKIGQSFSSIGEFQFKRAVIEKNKKVGLTKPDGTVALEPRYEKLRWSASHILASSKFDGAQKWIILDSMGQPLSPKLYDTIEDFNGKFFPVKSRGYWGGVDRFGKETIACVFDSIVQQKNDHVVVLFKGQYGVISLQQEWIIIPQQQQLQLLNHERLLERTPTTTFLKSFDKNIIYFSDNKLAPQEDFLLEYLSSGTIWKIDMDGRIVDRQVHPDEPIQRILPESEGLRGIQRNGKFGFVDARGRLRIANRYEDIKIFSEGLAAAKIMGKWGYINHEDKIAIQPVYDEVTSFSNGFAYIKQKGLYGLIDKNGSPVLPPRYEKIKVLSSGRLLIQQEGNIGLADARGEILINPKYNRLEDTDNGYVIVEWNGKYGLLTLQGISTIPLIYDKLIFNPFENQFIGLKKSPWMEVKL
ncbi:MAG: WG repeat-containing protein [Cyclobacteriaceae bacterium]|nr:WG repeat-containing protein [Cyclobacteriaceae bacterium]